MITTPQLKQHSGSPLGSPSCSPFLTVTGADERTDVAALAKLEAEIGLLYTETPEGRNRYPRWEWIRETSLELRRASLHVCGRAARAKLMEGKLPVSGFQRIQVNGGILALEVEYLCEMYPRHTIITQHHGNNAHLLFVRSRNHAILIDASGGRGISPSGWSQPATEKAVGFAGGLGPDNLAAELQTISRIARPGWWVDMEGKLRVDDWFSLELAGEVIAQFSSVNAGGQPRGNPLRILPDGHPRWLSRLVRPFFTMKATEEMSELRAAIELAGASPALTHCTILATELAARVEWLERYHEETLADHASGAPLHMIGDLAVKRATLALAVPEYPQPRSFGRSNARNLPRDE